MSYRKEWGGEKTSLGGYHCVKCGRWVPSGIYHACWDFGSGSAPSPAPEKLSWTLDARTEYQRIADALERLADAVERLEREMATLVKVEQSIDGEPPR